MHCSQLHIAREAEEYPFSVQIYDTVYRVTELNLNFK